MPRKKAAAEEPEVEKIGGETEASMATALNAIQEKVNSMVDPLGRSKAQRDLNGIASNFPVSAKNLEVGCEWVDAA